MKYRNFGLTVTKKRRGFLLRPIYLIEITDGDNTIKVREENGFRVKTNIKFPKPIIEK
jgi:UDP-3-O-acyl-N-acetylglucosamine deacetylase